MRSRGGENERSGGPFLNYLRATVRRHCSFAAHKPWRIAAPFAVAPIAASRLQLSVNGRISIRGGSSEL